MLTVRFSILPKKNSNRDMGGDDVRIEVKHAVIHLAQYPLYPLCVCPYQDNNKK